MKSGSNETAEYARKYVAKGFKGNQIPDTTSQYPKFKLNEITVGKVLGKGGFGTVSVCLLNNALSSFTRRPHQSH